MDRFDNDISAERFSSRLLTHVGQMNERLSIPFDWEQMSTASGLQVSASGLNMDGAAIGFEQYYRLLIACAPQFGDSDFFIVLGNDYDITDLGVLGYAMLSAQNLQKSWQLSLHSESLLHHPLQCFRQVSKGRVSVELSAPMHHDLLTRALTEEWVFGTWRWIRQRLPEIENTPGLKLSLAYPKPAYHKRYRDFFSGEMQFSQAKTELSFPESWYYRKFQSANPATAELCMQQCRLIQANLKPGDNLLERVRDKLLLMPQREFPDLQSMAESFKMPSHSFHRRLKSNGVNYRAVVTEVKMGLAKHYLLNTKLPLQEISYLLDYEHSPSFYRAFKVFFKQTPDSLRKNNSL